MHDVSDSIPEPATEFGCARKQAYRLSQDGRAALERLAREVAAIERIDEAGASRRLEQVLLKAA